MAWEQLWSWIICVVCLSSWVSHFFLRIVQTEFSFDFKLDSHFNFQPFKRVLCFYSQMSCNTHEKTVFAFCSKYFYIFCILLSESLSFTCILKRLLNSKLTIKHRLSKMSHLEKTVSTLVLPNAQHSTFIERFLKKVVELFWNFKFNAKYLAKKP